MGRILENRAPARGALALILAATLGLIFAGGARAATVLMLGSGGHVSVRSNPYLPAAEPTDGVAPSVARVGRGAAKHAAAHPRARARLRAAVPAPTPPQVLQTLYQQGQISNYIYTTDLRIWNKGVAAEPQFTGTPAAEMGAVIANTEQFAASGEMTASRLQDIFVTLWRNRLWWATGQVPTSGQRIEFSGSQMVWEYYPGQGIQLQVLGTFGTADGLYTAGPSDYSQMLSLVNEMLPMAAMRNGALTWEYLFYFENGVPPWTSAMSQATAIEALTRASWAATAQGNSTAAANYLSIAHQALAILQQQPPEGVAVPTARGTRFLMYSYNPDELVINGFLQTLIGLYDYAKASGDSEAWALFNAGNAEAQYELPSYDTGAWSLYEPGQEDTLSYHELVTGFLQSLCQRTSASIYCTTAQHFESYLTTAPKLVLQTTTAHAGTPISLAFTLSKISNISIAVLSGSQTAFSSSNQFGYGTDTFTVPALKAGSYTVQLTATDLAGNVSKRSGTLTVS